MTSAAPECGGPDRRAGRPSRGPSSRDQSPRARRWIASWTVLCCVAVAASGPRAWAAAEPRFLGVFGDWSAYVVSSGSAKHCFAYSEPTDARGNYSSRGKISITVSHRPAESVRDEVSLTAGYTYKPESEVEVTIDGSLRFLLFTDGGSAWAQDSEDGRLRRALEKGAKMVARGRSSRGTLTTDTYSLSGITDALQRIDKECPVGT
jgi:hypothetical protein